MFKTRGRDYSEPKGVFSNLLTVLYSIPLLVWLWYTKYIYNIGKYTSLSVICIIAGFEIVKLFITPIFTNSNSDLKYNKVKKYNKLRLEDAFKCCVLIAITIALCHIVAILFGAPFFNNHEETFMFSLLINTLTVFPSCINMGFDKTVNMLMSLNSHQENLQTDMFRRNVCLTLLGTWLGAVPIPLDWDRQWQEWPITCCIGAMIGFVLSNITVCIQSTKLYKLIVNIQKKIRL